MKFTVAVLSLMAFSQAHAVKLAPGEATTINGTYVICEGTPSQVSNCKLEQTDRCQDGAVKILLDGKPITECKWLANAIDELKRLKEAGVCR